MNDRMAPGIPYPLIAPTSPLVYTILLYAVSIYDETRVSQTHYG